MKKTILCIVLIISVYNLKSQEYDFGVKFGVAWSNIIPEYSDLEFDYYPGFIIGASNRFLWKNIYLKPEIQITQKGFQKDAFTYRFNTLELPIYIGYDFNLNNKIHILSEIGTFYSIGINQEISNYEVFKVYDNLNVIKNPDYGFSGGIGSQYKNIVIWANYYRSFNGLPSIVDEDFQFNIVALTIIFNFI